MKDELAETRQEHERKCAEFKLKVNEMAAAMEAAADNAAASDEIENLKRINAETLESLDGERSKRKISWSDSVRPTNSSRANAARRRNSARRCSDCAAAWRA